MASSLLDANDIWLIVQLAVEQVYLSLFNSLWLKSSSWYTNLKVRAPKIIACFSFEEIWTPQTFQHFSRITLCFHHDELRLYLPETAETFTPFGRGGHGRLLNMNVLMFYLRSFVIDSFLQESQSIFRLRACVSISIFPCNLNAPFPPTNCNILTCNVHKYTNN